MLKVPGFVMLVAAVLLVSTISTTAEGASLTQLKANQTRVLTHIRMERSQLGTLQQQAYEAQAVLARADQRYQDATAALATSQLELAGARLSVERARQRLAAVRQLLNQDRVRLGRVLRSTEEQSPLGLMAVLLGAASFTDFVTRGIRVAEIEAYQSHIIRLTLGELSKLRALGHRLVLALAARQAAVVAARNAYAQAQAAALARQRALAGVQQNIALVSTILSQLEARNASLSETIHQLEVEVASGRINSRQLVMLVDSVASEYGIDPHLILDVIDQESGGAVNARSRAGALGLMQLMPSTAAMLGVANSLNPRQNVQGGVRYLSSLLREFHGNLALALAAYNAGPNAVKAYGGIPPYPQTLHYVAAIMAHYRRNHSVPLARLGASGG